MKTGELTKQELAELVEILGTLTEKNPSGKSNIIEQLVTTGECLTTDSVTEIFGVGYISNFISDVPASIGVDLWQWTLSEGLWKWPELHNIVRERRTLANKALGEAERRFSRLNVLEAELGI